MEAKATQSTPMAELSPLIAEILQSGGSVEMRVTGDSMRPFLFHKRSKVRIAPPDGVLKRGDIPLYQRKDGAYVLHRVLSVASDGSYTMCGDAQWYPERGIAQSQILAVVTDFSRRGVWHTCESHCYRVYWKLWLGILPLRHLIGGGMHRILSLFSARGSN